MRCFDANAYTADRAWDALDITTIENATVRLHWADQPYIWHVNDGPEVFVVLDGAVDMHYRDAEGEHVGRPAPQARILVIERNGSI